MNLPCPGSKTKSSFELVESGNSPQPISGKRRGQSESAASHSEFALTEFGCRKKFVFGVLDRLWLGCPIIVRGCAATIRRSHIHRTGMFARTTSVSSNTTSPASAIAGGGSVLILERLVFFFWI